MAGASPAYAAAIALPRRAGGYSFADVEHAVLSRRRSMLNRILHPRHGLRELQDLAVARDGLSRREPRHGAWDVYRRQRPASCFIAAAPFLSRGIERGGTRSSHHATARGLRLRPTIRAPTARPWPRCARSKADAAATRDGRRARGTTIVSVPRTRGNGASRIAAMAALHNARRLEVAAARGSPAAAPGCSRSSHSLCEARGTSVEVRIAEGP